MATTPAISENPLLAQIRQQARQQAQAPDTPPPSLMPPPGMDSAAPPIMPQSQQPNVQAPRGTLTGEKNEQARLVGSKPGMSQVYDKITGSDFGQNHPLAGKLLGGAAQGLSTLGNIALSGAAPRLASLVPGTSAHHAALVGQENQNVNQLQGQEQKEALTQETNARTPLIQAQTDLLKNPPDKYAPLNTAEGVQAFDPKEGTAKPLTDASGKTLQPFSPDKTKTIDEQAYGALVAQGKTPVEALDTIYGSKNTKTEDLPHLYLDALQAGDAAKAALIKKAHEDTQVKPTQPPGITMIVPDPNNPGGGVVQRLTAGSRVAPGAQTAAGVNSVNTPTTQMRNVEKQAELVHQEMPGLISEINQTKDLLGPISGQWNEFMQGKVGMDNPRMAGLRSDLLMMSSAVALMHARGRLPENLREEFDRTINAPKQSPENLIATLQHIDKWTKDNMATMGGGADQGPKEGDTKVNGAGIKVKFSNGIWGPA